MKKDFFSVNYYLLEIDISWQIYISIYKILYKYFMHLHFKILARNFGFLFTFSNFRTDNSGPMLPFLNRDYVVGSIPSGPFMCIDFLCLSAVGTHLYERMKMHIRKLYRIFKNLSACQVLAIFQIWHPPFSTFSLEKERRKNNRKWI